jgi:hypothetical protein
MKIYFKIAINIFFLIVLITGISCKTATTNEVIDPIRISSENPFYWEYKGEPMLLLGGSREDNLFNHPEGLAEHLDLLKSFGGNYIRNTMSSRDPGNLWPHKMLENGLYDLTQWNEEYWHRFENLLKLSFERDIIVQIDIWDSWDYFMSEKDLGFGHFSVGWESCPYNPILNINYTPEESGLATDIDYYSGDRPGEHVFFHTVPALKDIPVIRVHQEAFVDKFLSISLEYPNVLYCMNNETAEPAEWGEYWAAFIRNRAKEAGKEVFLADMRDTGNFESKQQVKLLHDRTHYDFFEISQNNVQRNQRHYDQIMSIRDQVVDQPKPVNNVKIYGGTAGWTGSVEEGTNRFWRNIFGGCASSRFHRAGPSPYMGLGLSDLAQTHIRSMRMFTDEMDIFKCIPSNHLLSNRNPNEAYCFAEEGKQYAIYFSDGGEVMLDFTEVEGELEIRWMNIVQSAWLETKTISGNQQVMIIAPGRGQWAVLIQRINNNKT